MFILNIKAIREEQNMSLNRLHKLSGITYSYLLDLENNNKNNPSLDIIYKISLALDKKIDDLIISARDIEEARNMLHESINKFGLMHEKTQKISQLLDLMIVEEMRKQNSTNEQN